MTVWTLSLAGLGLDWLNANQRSHWGRRARSVQEIRSTACMLARASRIPRLDSATVLAYVHPATRRRRWDPANWYPTVKAAIDGLVDAGVVADDDHEHVVGPIMLPGPRVRGGGVTLVVTPVTGCSCGHDRLEHVHGMRCVRPGCECAMFEGGDGGNASVCRGPCDTA